MEHIDAHTLAYLENRLDAATRAQVENHLEECATCQAELLAAQTLVASLTEAGRAVQKMPVNPARSWAVVRDRWQSPIVAGVRSVSRRLSWQVAVSVAVTAMALLSGMSLNSVRAAGPGIPFIQTPAAQTVASGSDTPTLAATNEQTAIRSQTPTQTLTLTVPPLQ
jgi:anti-sigma factor RsiW